MNQRILSALFKEKKIKTSVKRSKVFAQQAKTIENPNINGIKSSIIKQVM